jgi:hypothetical protein
MKIKRTVQPGAQGAFTKVHKGLSGARQLALPNMRLALRKKISLPPEGSFPEESRSLII